MQWLSLLSLQTDTYRPSLLTQNIHLMYYKASGYNAGRQVQLRSCGSKIQRSIWKPAVGILMQYIENSESNVKMAYMILSEFLPIMLNGPKTFLSMII